MYPKQVEEFVEMVVDKFELSVEDATRVAMFLSSGDMVYFDTFLHHMR